MPNRISGDGSRSEPSCGHCTSGRSFPESLATAGRIPAAWAFSAERRGTGKSRATVKRIQLKRFIEFIMLMPFQCVVNILSNPAAQPGSLVASGQQGPYRIIESKFNTSTVPSQGELYYCLREYSHCVIEHFKMRRVAGKRLRRCKAIFKAIFSRFLRFLLIRYHWIRYHG